MHAALNASVKASHISNGIPTIELLQRVVPSDFPQLADYYEAKVSSTEVPAKYS